MQFTSSPENEKVHGVQNQRSDSREITRDCTLPFFFNRANQNCLRLSSITRLSLKLAETGTNSLEPRALILDCDGVIADSDA